MLHIGWDNLEGGFLQMHKVTSALCLLLSQVFIPVLFPPQAAAFVRPFDSKGRLLDSAASYWCSTSKRLPFEKGELQSLDKVSEERGLNQK